jgi:CHAT domain
MADVLTRARRAYHDAVADPSEFAARADGLVAEARLTGSAEALVLALRAQAWAERAHWSGERAKTLLDDAARIARRAGLRERLGEVLVTRAAVNHELGRLASAQHDLDAAGSLTAQEGTAELALQQAALHQNIGRLTTAATLYRRVLTDPRASVDVKAKSANNLALIDVQLGAAKAADAHIELATDLADEVGPALRAIVAQSRAWVTVQTGRLAEGLRRFEQAAQLYSAAGLPLGEHYLEYADALEELRLIPEARVVARRAVEEFERNQVALMAAEGQLRVARLAVLAGDGAAAVVAAEAAAASFARQRRTVWAARAATVLVDAQAEANVVTAATLTHIRRAAATLERLGVSSYAVYAHLSAGRIALTLGRNSVAVASLRRAHQLSARSAVLVRLNGHLAAALDARLAGSERGVLRYCRAGLTDLDRHRATLGSMELRVRAADHGVELAQLALKVALRRGSPGEVLRWMERTRAAALMAVEPADLAGADDELAALQKVQEELAEARTGSRGEPAALLARQAILENRIRQRTWARAAAAGAVERPLSPRELRQILGGRALVEYGILDGRLFAVLLQPRRARVVELGEVSTVRFHVDALLFALRRMLRPSRSAASAAAARLAADAALDALHGLLVAPLRLSPDQPLVVVTVGALQRVPWCALLTGPVSVAPSASFWARSLKPVPSRVGHVVLVAGPALPGAGDEIEALRSLHRGATVLAPPDSTVSAVTTALANADLAHLACHGRLRSDNPSFSALQLSGGALTVHELYSRGIAPPRMILAACDSGADVAYAGNEVLGFVSALLARGTGGLVASIVLISDAAAVPLMRGLHTRVRGGARLGDGLHSARGDLDRSDPDQFVNWCAFNAYGAA